MKSIAFDNDAWVDLKEVVMGLRWAAPNGYGNCTEPANLDAICLLLDAQSRVLEAIHPSSPANDNGSVMHTGDSRTGAGQWDDERVFVFLDALPTAVESVVFGVVSVNGRPFCDVVGASCYVGDPRMEEELMSVELTSLGPVEEYCVATLHRKPGGWIMRKGAFGVSGMRGALCAG